VDEMISSIVNPKGALASLQKIFSAIANRSFFNEDDVFSLFCKYKTGGMAAGFDIVAASIMMVSLLAGIIGKDREGICCVLKAVVLKRFASKSLSENLPPARLQ
jgi:hypothetical protein